MIILARSGKKKPYGSSSVPSLPTAPCTCALPAPQPQDLASKGSQRPTSTVPLHLGDRKASFKKDFFKKNYFKSKHEGRERKRRSKSPQFGALPSGFGMNERHSFQAALELGVCGGKGNDGQHPPATEPQGNQSCCPPAQPCPGRPGGAGGPGAHSLPVTGAL